MTESTRVLYLAGDGDTEWVATTLAERGFAVDTATGVDGVDRLAGGDYDCVVADPAGGDGVALIEAVRESEPDLPCLLLVENVEGIAEAAIAAGATDCLRRGSPEADTLLANRVEHAVAGYRAERERSFFEALVEQTGVGVAVYGADGRYEYVNEAFAAILDRDREAVLGEPIWAFNPTFEADRFESYWDSLSPGETRVETAVMERADGDRVPVETTTTCESLDGTSYHFGTVVDISERAALEAELANETNMFSSLMEQVPVGIYFKNEAAEHVRISDHQLDNLEATWGETPDGEPFTEETVVGRTDEELIPAEVAAETMADDRRVIEDGEAIRKEEHLRTPGDRDTWVHTTKVPWYDEDGEIRGLIGVSVDISDRKRSQLELQRQNERLEEFASIVSHDLRNPLNVAQGQLALAQEDHDSDRLESVARAQDRMERLIDDLLTLAREGDEVTETDPVDLAEVVGQCWRHVATAEATLDVRTDRVIEADRSRLQQLIENLVGNAVEHGGDDVTITVGDLDGGFFVADDGPGIPDGDRDQVFESGYSTAEDGTGFGLAIVEEIAHAHGWEITVTESESGGARFEITGVETAPSES